MHVFRRWEEAGEPEENPRIHGENMQTPHRKAPGGSLTWNPLAVRHQCCAKMSLQKFLEIIFIHCMCGLWCLTKENQTDLRLITWYQETGASCWSVRWVSSGSRVSATWLAKQDLENSSAPESNKADMDWDLQKKDTGNNTWLGEASTFLLLLGSQPFCW